MLAQVLSVLHLYLKRVPHNLLPSHQHFVKLRLKLLVVSCQLGNLFLQVLVFRYLLDQYGLVALHLSMLLPHEISDIVALNGHFH